MARLLGTDDSAGAANDMAKLADYVYDQGGVGSSKEFRGVPGTRYLIGNMRRVRAHARVSQRRRIVTPVTVGVAHFALARSSPFGKMRTECKGAISCPKTTRLNLPNAASEFAARKPNAGPCPTWARSVIELGARPPIPVSPPGPPPTGRATHRRICADPGELHPEDSMLGGPKSGRQPPVRGGSEKGSDGRNREHGKIATR